MSWRTTNPAPSLTWQQFVDTLVASGSTALEDLLYNCPDRRILADIEYMRANGVDLADPRTKAALIYIVDQGGMPSWTDELLNALFGTQE